MRKILILTLITFITIGLTYFLIGYVGLRGFLFAWVLNLMLMMSVFKFTEELKGQFTSRYYNEQSWEHKGKIYEYLGIHSFRKLLVIIGWEKLNKKSNPVENNTAALMYLHYRTKQSELGHLIILFIVIGFTVYVAFKFNLAASIYLLGLNIVLNLYPIFLQRYNRPRLEKAIRLSQYKEERKHHAITQKTI
jgi:hypothetical protein